MKALTTVSLFIIVFTLFSSKANAANNITFKAADDNIATKLCVAAVSNDLEKTIRYIKSLSWEIHGGMYQKTNFVSNDLMCNNTNLVMFTAKYDAEDTFEYFNKRAVKKYRLNTDEVEVIDLARQNALPSHPQIIVITSR